MTLRLPRATVALLALIVVVTGCERVVQVSAPLVATRLVVEARLEQVRGGATAPQRIRLTETDSYFSGKAPPPVTGAVVRVLGPGGVVTSFAASATEPGVYLAANLPLEFGAEYTLQITYKGDEYQARDTAHAVAAIDSLYFAPRSNANFGPALGLRATVALHEPAGVRNFYLWEQYVDGRRLVTTDTTGYFVAVASDDFFDGTFIDDLQPYIGIGLRAGQLVRVRQLAISEQAYRYFLELNDQANPDGSPFGVPPASLRGNVANLAHPQLPALGYFIAAEVAEATGRVP